MKNHKEEEIWIGGKDLGSDPEFLKTAGNEFTDTPLYETMGDATETESYKTDRRDFLKYLGFGLGAATVASCDIPVKKALPYVVKPDTIVPGIPNYYASSYVNGGDFCSVLVKTREGRPIKIEGNSLSSVSMGGTSARAQAYVLSLYDTNRFKGPIARDGENGLAASTWEAIDAAVKSNLNANSRIAIISNSILSPTTKKAVARFKSTFPNTKHVSYDPVSSSAILLANEASFGSKMIPDYRFDKANVIVSFGADFLGTWISPIEYARQYAKNRVIKNVDNASMSKHVQIENGMSLTGSNADNRILVKPSQQGAAIAALCNLLGGSGAGPSLPKEIMDSLRILADELKGANGKALVVSNSNNVSEQILINKINDVLGSYGNTISFAHPSMQRQGIDADVNDLIADMNAGRIDAVMVYGANPAYDFPGTGFAEAMAKVDFKLSFAQSNDETTALCDYVAPDHHGLESWGDAEPKLGHCHLIQPTINPLFNTRQAQSSLLTWAGESVDYYDYLKSNWTQNILGGTSWDKALHDGFHNSGATNSAGAFSANVGSALSNVTKPNTTDLEINFYETVHMGNGQFANNPWLMEMPDPVTRTSWSNILHVPVKFNGVRKFIGFNDLEDGDTVTLTVNGVAQTAVVVQQFGQMPGTVSLALGYGREVGGKSAVGYGTNVNTWLKSDSNGLTQYYATDVAVSGKTGEDDDFASVQYHHTMGVKDVNTAGEEVVADELATGTLVKGFEGSLTNRSIIRRSHIADVKDFVHHLHEERHHFEHLNEQTLYPYDEYKEDLYDQGHHWGMHVDLNACIGCGACTVACIAENNVPIVGKHEVHRHHEMTWLRIDRYFYGDADNPNTVYQPMMCQHCDNAPCENVCPVNATNHSSEGLNQMAYNRCVGTRYCANNCPYKVRRFNWLDYTTADLWPSNEPELTKSDELPFGADNLTRMVLNPDVTVRSRGVIEKCSFCTQRIQSGKLVAKKEGRRLEDRDVRTACQTACPTGAITFGDTNNKKGQLSKKLRSPLNYVVLEEVNTRSSVNYSAKLINKIEKLDA